MTIREAQCKVADFMRAGNQEVAETPRVLPWAAAGMLRYKLGLEELNEYAYACRYSVEEIADALADQLYILLGTANAHGIDLEPVFSEVHRSNMTNVVGGRVLVNDAGKICKPEGYEPPDIAGVLARQMEGA